MKEVTFEGIPSGDGECFCFKVTADVYRLIAGEDRYRFEIGMRDEWTKEIGGPYPGNPDEFYLYPNDMFGYSNNGEKLKITFKVENV
jgi:hypothetical protein